MHVSHLLKPAITIWSQRLMHRTCSLMIAAPLHFYLVETETDRKLILSDGWVAELPTKKEFAPLFGSRNGGVSSQLLNFCLCAQDARMIYHRDLLPGNGVAEFAEFSSNALKTNLSLSRDFWIDSRSHPGSVLTKRCHHPQSIDFSEHSIFKDRWTSTHQSDRWRSSSESKLREDFHSYMLRLVRHIAALFGHTFSRRRFCGRSFCQWEWPIETFFENYSAMHVL